MANNLELLHLESLGENRFSVHQPEGSPEGGNVVFGGQLMAQIIMAADAECGGSKYVKSMNTVFSRAGLYSEPIHLTVEPFQSGRTFGADIVTAWQGERLLTRAQVMLSSDEPDLITHQVERPDVSNPEDGETSPAIAFPGADVRTAKLPSDTANGVSVSAFWTRMPEPVGSLAASQAIVGYATNGQLIELAMRGHDDVVRIQDAHLTLTTGVVNHTLNFHREFDAGDWTLIVQEATFAGKGRVHGRGTIYRQDGALVATFSQDSMVKPGGRGPGSAL
ncbi:acyl-CoA thioesterase [Jatrophihabitans sp. DSM 45814]